MAIVETLELRFQANLGNLAAQLKAVGAQLAGMDTALNAAAPRLSASGSAAVQAAAGAMLAAAMATGAPSAAGARLASGLSGGILGGLPGVSSAALAAANAADFADSGAAAGAVAAGAALSQGFANGILARMGTVLAAADRVASAAVKRIRSALQIHSPSRLSYGLGAYFGEGFAEGMRASVRLVKDGAAELSGAAFTMLAPQAVNPAAQIDPGGGLGGMVRSAMGEALGGTSITVPLHVDGVKLGEASIRGINSVTRSAGRVMLEI